jgi:hypoxanthine phosphoribosyltransferase
MPGGVDMAQIISDMFFVILFSIKTESISETAASQKFPQQ